MQAQKESPPDMQCKDKFLVQSVAAENGATTQDINAAMVSTLALLIGFISTRLLHAYISGSSCHMSVCAFMTTVQ
jgi:hypothetical protein